MDTGDCSASDEDFKARGDVFSSTDGLQDDQHVEYVATSQGLLRSSNSELKTTHIVIHNQTLSHSNDPLKSPTTPLPPPTPSTPLSRERGFRYQWDSSAFDMVLPIRCKSSSAELHKARFGSGGRGRCIKLDDIWYTPSEFEAVCGRSCSKDWKRSVHYAGRTLQCLIEDGILQPHATSCSCAACCDDESVTGPVRLFVPYKRRKRDFNGELVQKKSISTSIKPIIAAHHNKDAVLVSFNGLSSQPLGGPETGNMIHIISAEQMTSVTLTEQLELLSPSQPIVSKLTTSPLTPASCIDSAHSSPDNKLWSQLEDMANSLVEQAQELKELIEQTKQQMTALRDNTVDQLKAQLEKEKNEAINGVRIEAQMQLARAIVDERTLKDIAIQQALAQARAELHEKLGSVVVCDDKTTYTVTWAAQSEGIDDVIDDVTQQEGEEEG